MYAQLRAAGKKPDLALIVCDTDAVSAGESFVWIFVRLLG